MEKTSQIQNHTIILLCGSNSHFNKNKMITEKFKASKRHETESSEINPNTYDRLIFSKSTKAIYWKKNIFLFNIFLTNSAGQLYIHM